MSDELVKAEEKGKLVHLVATDAMQMAAAQTGLTIWLKDKIADLDCDITEITEARDYAKSHKWRVTSFGNQINKAEKRRMFYVKLLVAAEAGYTIVPNMPLDLMAVRIDDKEYGPSDTERQTWNNDPMPTAALAEKARILPVGEGDYISPTPNVSRYTTEEKSGDRSFTAHHVRAISLKDMEFPVSVAIPQIMDATAKAMALKVFDQIGICPAKGIRSAPHSYHTQQLPPARDPDPLIIGQVLSPKFGYSGAKPVSFLIAWHLDLRTL